MRKRIWPLLMVLVLILCFSGPVALASDIRGITYSPNLTIDGTTAKPD